MPVRRFQAVMAGDDQAYLAGELGLLNQAKRLGSIVHPAHVSEVPPQEREEQRCLEGIVVHDEDACHGP